MALEQIKTKLAIFAPPDVTVSSAILCLGWRLTRLTAFLQSPWFQATRDRFRIAFRKQEYYEDICALKECIAELKRIRKLAKKHSEAKTKRPHKEYNEPTAEPFSGSYVTTVRQYKAIWRLSLDFQALLQQQWSCSDGSHSHSGRLFLRYISQQNYIAWLLEYAGRRGCTSLR